MGESLNKKRDFAQEAKVFKAFCDENRLRILDLLSSGECCVCELLHELDVVQSTLSHHMKILVESGIVNTRKEGKWSYYTINEEGARFAMELLDIVVLTRKEARTESERFKRECGRA